MKNTSWFTVEKIDAATYAISEYHHWEQPHSYLVIGEERALLIDTGLGIGDIKEIVDSLTDKPVFVVTTHVHWDHIGGHAAFDHIGVHVEEKQWLTEKFPLTLENVKSELMKKAFDAPCSFDLEKYTLFQCKNNPEELHDLATISLGNREILVLHTPGHSPGHLCFYEAKTGYLFTGDLVYQGTLDAYYPTTDPQKFFQSLRKIEQYDITRILPGHYTLELPTTFLVDIRKAFQKLETNQLLYQGSGIHEFTTFAIHL